MKPYWKAYEEVHKIGYTSMGLWFDELGRQHTWRIISRNGDKVIKQDVIEPTMPFFATITRVTVKCADCGTEYVLFDNRCHGYDGVTGKHTDEHLAYVPAMRQRRGGPISIQVKIENDETPESFQECTAADVSDYSDAFSWIIIYKVKDGKKTKIFDAETA